MDAVLGPAASVIGPDDQGVLRLPVAETQTTYSRDALDVLFEHATSSWWTAHRIRWITTMLAEGGARHLLEVGAGNGSVAVQLAERGIDTVAVEPHYAGCARMARRGVTAVCATLGDLGLDGSVPAIGYFDVLEHLPDPDDELARAFRALQPGGLLLVTVPAFRWLWSDEDEFAGHRDRYTAGSLRRLVTAHGFDVIRVEYLFASLVLPALLLRRLPFLVRRARPSMTAASRNLARQLDPPRPVSALATTVLRIETAVARRLTIPFGLSVAAAFRKP